MCPDSQLAAGMTSTAGSDPEAQLGASRNTSPTRAAPPAQSVHSSATGLPPAPHLSRHSTLQSAPNGSLRNSPYSGQNGHRDSTISDLSRLDEEESNLFQFAEDLQNEKADPWFLEMTRLRRMHFLYLNKCLATTRKRLLETRCATDQQMKDLGILLHEQAEAIRDFQYIHSLDYLTIGEKERLRQATHHHFPRTGFSPFPNVDPFDTENYRILPRHSTAQGAVLSDEIREFLRIYLPVSISWTNEEKRVKAENYRQKYAPTKLSPTADRLARFIVAMFGALFILVPMYIMALQQNRTKSLITTTIAVVLFAIVCSITLRATNDQTLGSTAAYAAVLVVFVGLTS